MKELFDALPDSVAPEHVVGQDHEDSPVFPPDDNDVIRPAAEDALLALGTGGSLVNVGDAPLAKHLLWTFGPHHRDLPFMLQLRVEIDGDRLVSVDPEIGWHHQGIERGLEQIEWKLGFELVARLQPRGPAGHILTYALALERMFGIEDQVPVRAQLWRCVTLELTRIREHLRLLSSLVLAHSERASQRIFFEAARRLTTLVELASHNHATYLLACVGGLADEIPEAVPDAIENALPDALGMIQAVGDRLWQNPAFTGSLSGLGVLVASDALGFGITGPALRACGVADDLRVSDPAFAYARVAPKMVTQESGDCLARFALRLDELAASSASVVRALAAFKSASGPVVKTAEIETDDQGRWISPTATTAASLEIASGEFSVIIRSAQGGIAPVRARLRGPSFPLAGALRSLLTGARLDDVVPILRSLGMSGPELDR